MTDDGILEAQLREALARDLSQVTPRPGGEGRLYRGMEGSGSRRPRPKRLDRIGWLVRELIVPATVALAIVVLVLAIPMVIGAGRGSVQPADRPDPTAVCPSVAAGEAGTLTEAGDQSAEPLEGDPQHRLRGVLASGAAEELDSPDESAPVGESVCGSAMSTTLDPGSGTVWSWLLRAKIP